MRIVAGFEGASLLASLFTWRRQKVRFADVARGRGPADLRKMAALEAETESGGGEGGGGCDGRGEDEGFGWWESEGGHSEHGGGTVAGGRC